MDRGRFPFASHPAGISLDGSRPRKFRYRINIPGPLLESKKIGEYLCGFKVSDNGAGPVGVYLDGFRFG